MAVIDAPLGKDEHSRVAIKDCVRADGAPARTEYWVLERVNGNAETTDHGPQTTNHALALSARPFTLLLVRPLTGRKHQIRIHLAHLGHPDCGRQAVWG